MTLRHAAAIAMRVERKDGQISSGLAGAMEPGGAIAPFRYPAFRAIWTANLFSAIGSSVQSVGAAWLMTDLTNSHRLIALVQASVTLPIMLFGVLAGAIADNFDRRRVMIAAQIGMLIASGFLALLTWEQVIGPYSLLAFTLAVGIGTALNSPAWQASVRIQVGRDDLPQAIALNTMGFNLARSVGPALGGLLISLAGMAAAFAANSVSYVAMIWVLFRWRPEAPLPARRPILPSIAAGLRYCLGSGDVRRILLRGFLIGIGISAYQALIPAIVRDRLKGDEFEYGLMLASFGLGSVGIALLLTRARQRWGAGTVVVAGTLCFAIALALLPLCHSIGPALPLAFVAGMGWVTCLTTLNVAMQLRSPEQILGRCLSIYSAATFGGMALGAWLWGAVADAWTLAIALPAGAIWMALNALVVPWLIVMPGHIDERQSES